ncbi:H-NS family nucleoid-associated regulatory protein, partial [Priestia sp. SIMBA_032]
GRVVQPKYQDPKTGATWSGQGRPPAWISEAKNRDDFLIDRSQASHAVDSKAAVKKSAASKTAVKAPTKRAAAKPAAKKSEGGAPARK